MQIARPTGDYSFSPAASGWGFFGSGGTNTAFDRLNLTQGDLGTHRIVTPTTINSTFTYRATMTALSKPATTDNHLLIVQARRNAGTAIQFTPRLIENVSGVLTTRYTWPAVADLDSSGNVHEYKFYLPTANAATIVNYANLIIELNFQTSGTATSAVFSWMMFRCPDALGKRRGRWTEDFFGQNALSGNWRPYLGAPGDLATASYLVGSNCLQLTATPLAVIFEFMGMDFIEDSFSEATMVAGYDNTKSMGGAFVRLNRNAVACSTDTSRYNFISAANNSRWEVDNDGQPVLDNICPLIPYTTLAQEVAGDVIRTEVRGTVSNAVSVKGLKNGVAAPGTPVTDPGTGVSPSYAPLTYAGSTGYALGSHGGASGWLGPTKLVMGSLPNFLPAPVDRAGAHYCGVGFGASF